MSTKFTDLPIDARWIEPLVQRDITEPTPIQIEAIPVIMAGRDLVAQSQTGTGKTLAYLLPVMERIRAELKDLQAVIIVPTRELGMQIYREAEMLCEGSGIRAQVLIGGASLQRQVEKLREHPQLAIGTPGRILELLGMRKLKLHQVKTIVVDETDQVFALGSQKEVEELFQKAMRDCQFAFFSATITDAILDTANRLLRAPATIRIAPEQKTASTLEHLYVLSDERDKIDMLRRLVRLVEPKAAIVFVNETDRIGEVAAKLDYAGLSVQALYADSDKQARAAVLNGFRGGKFQLLIATDIAARGLDIPGVSHVFQFDPAIDADHYVHRAGRTGRMGRAGTVITIVTKKQQFIIDKFAKALNISIHPKSMYKGKLVDPNEDLNRDSIWRSASVKNDPRVQSSVSLEKTEGRRRSNTAVPLAQTGRAEPRRNSDRQGAPAKEPSDRQAASANRSAGNGGRNASTRVSGGGGQKSAASPGAPQRKENRERDRKNKGAPKWLKEKRSGGKTTL